MVPSDMGAWPLARLGLFVIVNLVLGGLIYAVFKKIGLIGSAPSES